VTPPIWLDENGERRPTRPCPKCGLPDPIIRLRYEHLRANGWKPCKTLLPKGQSGKGHSGNFTLPAWPSLPGSATTCRVGILVGGTM
jgi:hypothetical protein